MLKPINETTYDFPELIEGGFIYVDKTAALQQLIANRGAKLCFISRPRRFGKSLMLSTLKAIFQGRRELFEGLAIAKTDYDWSDVYPVIHFDFGTMDVETREGFQRRFVARVKNGLQDAGYDYDDALDPDVNFGKAINELVERHGKPVVVLIDEYDAPVGHAIADPDKAETIRERMAAFYGQLKLNVAKIRFLMMTGVTKFTQLSVFSALNNLKDFTLSAQYAPKQRNLVHPSIWQETPQQYFFLASWHHKGLFVEVGCQRIFDGAYKERQWFDYGVYAIDKATVKNNLGSSAWVKLSYSFDFGRKKVERTKMDVQKGSSGIMKI